jgi:single-strand DNA-binding protein
MAGSNINRVIITGNLTKDPDLGALPSGTPVCTLRVACNGRRKNNDSGQWEDIPNYFDVTVWGQQGENCAQYLKKGRAVAVDGRLRWREWTTQDGHKRQAVDIIADTVQFLGGRDDAGNGNGNGYSSPVRAAESDVPIDTGDFEVAPVSGGAAEDDIPF